MKFSKSFVRLLISISPQLFLNRMAGYVTTSPRTDHIMTSRTRVTFIPYFHVVGVPMDNITEQRVVIKFLQREGETAANVYRRLRNSNSFFQDGILKLVPRWQKCIAVHGDYVEK